MRRVRCASRRKGRGQCQRYAAPGATVCWQHGGNIPVVQKKAAKRVALDELGLLNDDYRIDPTQALLDEITRANGEVQYWGARVRELEESSLTYGVVSEEAGIDQDKTTNMTKEASGLNIVYTAWVEARERLTKVAAIAIRVGVEERRVQLAEQQGIMIAGVIHRILGQLQLTPVQSDLVTTVVPSVLREIG